MGKGGCQRERLGKSIVFEGKYFDGCIAKIREKGYVEIGRDEKDKRNIVIRLTDEGRKLKEAAVNVQKALVCEHWLTDEEFITYKTLLYKLSEGDLEK